MSRTKYDWMGRNNSCENCMTTVIIYTGFPVLLPGALASPGLESLTADPVTSSQRLLACALVLTKLGETLSRIRQKRSI